MGKTYSTKGLDGEDHAITCEFITNDANPAVLMRRHDPLHNEINHALPKDETK